MAFSSEERPSVDTAMRLSDALATIRLAIPRIGTGKPAIGRPDLTYELATRDGWVEGFWSGELWLAYALTGEAAFRDAALQQLDYFEARLDRPETHDHDMGFLYSLSAVAAHEMTGLERARKIGLAAARRLAARFVQGGCYLQAWNDWPMRNNQGTIIIDSLENLALLFWAATHGGEVSFAEIAITHARTCVERLVRADGSTYHIYRFEPTTHAPLGGRTFQGQADESCWSRGQAWAIHGFTQIYAHTGDSQFLEAAGRVADFAVPYLREAPVPLWDYRLPPGATQVRDSSAAAISAAGLFALAEHIGRRGREYRDLALRILAELATDYTTTSNPVAEGLLTHGAAFVERGMSDHMLPYGDYFYLEALARATGHTRFFW